VRLEQTTKEAFSRCTVSTLLQKYIDYIPVLIDRPPQILLFAAYLYKYFINEKRVTEASMFTFQPFGKQWTKLVAPQPNGLIAHLNPAFGQ